ncbi:hypothetical protein Y032_0105g3698 [Ancylostoma ceylanicum]|uniref:Uncharacterized protein n=1 Tax=Ancylostoma ceylanicum TaxID=53326 RepID=A0A016TG73_9BILA|nr:hypothetical protein Y032_0105g3698 [Ancylostoma ceylanicum]
MSRIWYKLSYTLAETAGKGIHGELQSLQKNPCLTQHYPSADPRHGTYALSRWLSWCDVAHPMGGAARESDLNINDICRHTAAGFLHWQHLHFFIGYELLRHDLVAATVFYTSDSVAATGSRARAHFI